MDDQDNLKLSTDVSSYGELDGDNIQVQIDLRLQIEEIADLDAKQLRGRAPRPPGDTELRDLANKIYAERRLRNRIVGQKLFGEPAWDMLLALYCFPARGEFLTVTGLTFAAEVPQATGIRWQKVLSKQGVIERGPDGVDARMKFIRLTSTGKAMMDRILMRILEFETPRVGDVIRAHGLTAAGARSDGTAVVTRPPLMSSMRRV